MEEKEKQFDTIEQAISELQAGHVIMSPTTPNGKTKAILSVPPNFVQKKILTS